MQSHELLRSHRAHGIEIACAVQGRIDQRQYNTNSHKQGHAYYSCDHVKHRCIIICCIVRLDSSALHIRTNNMYAIRDLNTILNCNRPQTISHKSCSIYCFFFLNHTGCHISAYADNESSLNVASPYKIIHPLHTQLSSFQERPDLRNLLLS